MKLEEIYKRLLEAFGLLGDMYGNLDGAIKVDTAFALGEALGVVSKAKALVGRDIDDEKAGRDSFDVGRG